MAAFFVLQVFYKKNMTNQEFEETVKNNLINLNVSLLPPMQLKAIGAAVSGGADSVSLLVSLLNILKPLNISLKVITVNHFIRPDEETCGDADFVQNLCSEFYTKGYDVDCKVVNLEKGAVFSLASNLKTSVEAAARQLRYEAFENFAKENNLNCICLAHNKNDQLETLLMRFLQGSSVEAMGGICSKRDIYFRPLLNISRSEIEEYLFNKKISFRTDKTNFDNNYLRNRIRNKLIPLLNEDFSGWQTAVLKGADKYQEDGNIIQLLADDFEIKLKNNTAILDKENFIKQAKGIQKRLLLKACNLIGKAERIPDVFLEDVLKNVNLQGVEKACAEMTIIIENNKVLVKKTDKKHTDLVFFDIIEESGTFEFPFGKLEVIPVNTDKFLLSFNGIPVQKEFSLPVCIRNLEAGDMVKTSNGNYKKITDVFSDWHVGNKNRPENIDEAKRFIPIVQELITEKQEIICIAGEFLGFYNWIVKNENE